MLFWIQCRWKWWHTIHIIYIFNCRILPKKQKAKTIRMKYVVVNVTWCGYFAIQMVCSAGVYWIWNVRKFPTNEAWRGCEKGRQQGNGNNALSITWWKWENCVETIFQIKLSFVCLNRIAQTYEAVEVIVKLILPYIWFVFSRKCTTLIGTHRCILLLWWNDIQCFTNRLVDFNEEIVSNVYIYVYIA